MTFRSPLLALLSIATAAAQQLPAGLANRLNKIAVTEVEIRADPEPRTRPRGWITLQAIARGEITDENGEARRVRPRVDGAAWKINEEGGGQLSKSFRYQGEEPEPFYESDNKGLGSLILREATTRFVLQDAVVYHAPDKEGKYTVTAELDGRTATVEITVEAGAPSPLPDETTSFDAEPRSSDPYRQLVEHYAPFIAQETWFDPKSDYLARFDFDGDWAGDDNWENAHVGSSQAYVHYAVMETATHWFLVYNMFHPRDYSDKCVAGSCHENDNEGLILAVFKAGGRFGTPQAIETLAHNNLYSHVGDARVRSGLHGVDGDIEFHEDSHPVVFIDSGGHGVYGSTGSQSRFRLSTGVFTAGTGVTYVYKGRAERPRHADDREVGYELLPIYDHWWLRAHEGSGREDRTFDAYFVYQPYGYRPRAKYPELAGAFLGRSESENKAKPFWGWHDVRSLKQKTVATGQWGLDPAYAMFQNLKFPQPYSLDYVFNPYLGIGEPPARRSAPVSESRPAPSAARGGLLAAHLPPDLDGLAESPSPPAPLPGVRLTSAANDPSRYSSDGEGLFEFRAEIDGLTVLRLRGDEVYAEAVSGRPPEVERLLFTRPLPGDEVRELRIEQREGRSKVELVGSPTAENGYTVEIRIDDRKSGSDAYRFLLRWTE